MCLMPNLVMLSELETKNKTTEQKVYFKWNLYFHLINLHPNIPTLTLYSTFNPTHEMREVIQKTSRRVCCANSKQLG